MKLNEIIDKLKEGKEIVCTFYQKTLYYSIDNIKISEKQFKKLYSLLKIDRHEHTGITKHYYKIISKSNENTN